MQGNLVQCDDVRDAIGCGSTNPCMQHQQRPRKACFILPQEGQDPLQRALKVLCFHESLSGANGKLRQQPAGEGKQPTGAVAGAQQEASAAGTIGIDTVDASEAVVDVAIDGQQHSSSGAAGYRAFRTAVVQEGQLRQGCTRSPQGATSARRLG